MEVDARHGMGSHEIVRVREFFFVVLSIPVYLELSGEQRDEVIKALEEFLG